MSLAGPKRTARTNRRIAKIRLKDPSALAGIKADGSYTSREARQVFVASQRGKATKTKAPKPYNPLAPLTGDRLADETKAAERLEFGPKQDELRRAVANQRQDAANTSTYYDDYRKALQAATDRIGAANQAGITATAGRVDQAHAQDSASVAARNEADTQQAALLGRGPVQSSEGARAVAAQRGQSNQAIASMQSRAGTDTRYGEMRGANAALGKAQAMDRENARGRRLRDEERQLTDARGVFRTDFQRKSRQDERQYAALRKEFGLKEESFEHNKAQDRIANKTKAQATNTQKIVARIYASADIAKARAQVRVAELQLEKGKISQTQYRHIVNTYKGLKGDKSKSKGGSGSGPGGSLAPWETDKIDAATTSLQNNKVPLSDKEKWLRHAQKVGLPPRLANIAWRRHAKTFVAKGDLGGA